MPNKNYLSGRRLEYYLTLAAKKRGYKACRTAGSHGWIDVIIKMTTENPEAFLTDLGLECSNYGVWVRHGKKYFDTLYVEWYAPILLVQCKRKSIRHRTNRVAR